MIQRLKRFLSGRDEREVLRSLHQSVFTSEPVGDPMDPITTQGTPVVNLDGCCCDGECLGHGSS